MRRGAAGMGGRGVCTSNAWDPAEASSAQLAFEAFQPSRERRGRRGGHRSAEVVDPAGEGRHLMRGGTRAATEPVHVARLDVFVKIKPNKFAFAAKVHIRERLAELRLTNTRWAKE